MSHRGFSKRLNVACAAWGLDRLALAERAGLALPVVERALSRDGETPRLSDVKRLADALHVQEQWLSRGDIPMVPLWEMAVEEQFRVHTGPGSEGLPGYVVIAPGGPWFRDEVGEWQLAKR